jgi:hypothetical protein
MEIFLVEICAKKSRVKSIRGCGNSQDIFRRAKIETARATGFAPVLAGDFYPLPNWLPD